MIAAGEDLVMASGGTQPNYAQPPPMEIATNPAPADGGAGISGPMGLSVGLQLASVAMSIVNSYYGMKTSEVQANAALASGKSQYAHQDTMAEIQKQTQLNLIIKQEEKIQYQQDHNKDILASAEKRKAAEDDLKFAKEQVKTQKAYEKELKTYDGKVDKLFGRNGYYSGSPAVI